MIFVRCQKLDQYQRPHTCPSGLILTVGFSLQQAELVQSLQGPVDCQQCLADPLDLLSTALWLRAVPAEGLVHHQHHLPHGRQGGGGEEEEDQQPHHCAWLDYWEPELCPITLPLCCHCVVL